MPDSGLRRIDAGNAIQMRLPWATWAAQSSVFLQHDGPATNTPWRLDSGRAPSAQEYAALDTKRKEPSSAPRP